MAKSCSGTQDLTNDQELNDLLEKHKNSRFNTIVELFKSEMDKSRSNLLRTSLSSDRKDEKPSEPPKPKDILIAVKPARPDHKVERQVINYVSQTISGKEFKVQIIDWEKRGESTPLAVFCINASRIGVDIEHALKGVQDPKVVLIVLHYCRRALLRGDLSDSDYLLSDELKGRVAYIVHFAFDDDEGVYDCQQNRTARDMLHSKLHEHHKNQDAS